MSPEPDPTVEFLLDDRDETAAPHRRLIEVARERGAYVPGWCHHPSMRPATELEPAPRVHRPVDAPPARRVGARVPEGAPSEGTAVEGEAAAYEGCGLCVVEVDGELTRACETRVRPGMEVRTATDGARERQRSAMAELFRHHPHACLACPLKAGCDRITCSMNVPEPARCCDLLGNCELERSAEAIDLDWSAVPTYEGLDRPAQETPIMDVDWELCIGCLRCVGVCEDHVGAGVWQFTRERDADGGGGATVGLKAGTLAKAGCKLCTACVDACPTGTLMDADRRSPDERLPVEFRRSLDPVPFPRSALPLDRRTVEMEVPETAGVYTLYDADGEVTVIQGVPDLTRALLEEIGTGAVEFEFEPDENFTSRETELIGRYVNRHGHMPGAGGMMDELF